MLWDSRQPRQPNDFMKKILGFTAGIIILSSIFFNANIEKISAASFQEGLSKTGGAIGYNATDNPTLAGTIGKVLNIATTFLGVAFLVLMIYGGYTWMLAQGNEQEVERAKNIIIAAVIGLVVVLSAYAITQTLYWYFYGIKYGGVQ